MQHKLEYQTDGGTSATVKLDDEDVSTAVRGLVIVHESGELPSIELQLAGVPTGADIVSGYVRVDAVTKILLKKLGWTPPPDEKKSRKEQARGL